MNLNRKMRFLIIAICVLSTMNVLWIGRNITTHCLTGMTCKTFSNMINTLAGGAKNEDSKFNASARRTRNENNNFNASTKRNKSEINIAEKHRKIQGFDNTLEFCSLTKIKSEMSE
jgi:hypothetical protein